MKITLNNGAKRLLSLLLVFAVFVGSLFVANFGVNISADATNATTSVTYTWDGSSFDSELQGNGTPEDPYLITNAAEFAHVALNESAFNTVDKVYKVKEANAVFNMNGLTGININSTAAEVQAATPTSNVWKHQNSKTGKGFLGDFDGNGAIVYNVYSRDDDPNYVAGLFPLIGACDWSSGYDSLDANLTIKNITLKASYMESYNYTGGIIGKTIVGSGDTFNFENIVIQNCYMHCLQNTGVGFIASSVYHAGAAINNCLVAGNIIDSATRVGGFVADSTIYGDPITVSNSVVINSSPVTTAVDSSELNSKVTATSFSNVYTDDQSVSGTPGITVLNTNQMTGPAAADNITSDGFIWGFNWRTTDTYPIPIIPDTSYCWDGTTADAFADGSGTKDDPYIIINASQLHKMVCDGGEKEDGTPAYYKVSDKVSALYLNPVKDIDADMFNTLCTAGNSIINNWSANIPKGLCSGSCTHTYRPFTYNLFTGYFDGNGVTIYGLYSTTTENDSWLNGTGFFPGMSGNSVIKNVIFDTNYVKSVAESAGVVTSSFGLRDFGGDPTYTYCDETKLQNTGNVTIMNVAVRNAYVESKQAGMGDDRSYSGGIVGVYTTPSSLKIANCLFDGTNSQLVVTKPETATFTTAAGIYAQEGWDGILTISNSVSVGYNLVDNCGMSDNIVKSYPDNNYDATVTVIPANFTIANTPLLNWLAWDNSAKTLEKYGTPMPKMDNSFWEVIDDRYYKNTWKNELTYDGNPQGQEPVTGNSEGDRYLDGVFSKYNTLMGAGTEDDPYIITDAMTLYKIIASGGTHRGAPVHYQLGCDIDLQGIQWVNYPVAADRNQGSNANGSWDIHYYRYNSFKGVLDGNGHTIRNLYTATDDEAVGFIPVLEGGTVKNLRILGGYTGGTGSVGVIVGSNNGGTIENCVVEDVNTSGSVIAPNGFTNCYYYNANGSSSEIAEPAADEMYKGTDTGAEKMYKGANGVWRNLAFAKNMPCADINGDGYGYEYNTSDVVALKNMLLRQADYANVYGDVSRNGKTNIRDLVILQREIIGDEKTLLDGFWTNVAVGNVEVYYDYANDSSSYDSARSLALYLQESTGAKVETIGKTSAPETCAVKFVTDKEMGSANWSITYDDANVVLTFTAGSFTAMDAAVDEFELNSDYATGKVYTGSGAITGDIAGTHTDDSGNVYYYAWGDEFEDGYSNTDGTKTTVNYDKWINRGKFLDGYSEEVYEASGDQLFDTNRIENGTLVLEPQKVTCADVGCPGSTGGTCTSDSTGVHYIQSGVSTKNSILFNGGYFEMKVQLPSDGYSFPAWWLLSTNDTSNLGITNSLFSKVYAKNDDYDKVSNVFDSTNLDTYQYKLPTVNFEFDLFEIIQYPTHKLDGLKYIVKPGSDDDIQFTVHKWYDNAIGKSPDKSTLTVRAIDWENYSTTDLLIADGGTKQSDGKYSGYTTSDESKLNVNNDNLKSGQVNAANTYEGDSGEVSYSLTNHKTSSGLISEFIYGFYWKDNTLIFTVKDTNGNPVTDAKGNEIKYEFELSENHLAFDNYSSGNWTNQYAYMLIEESAHVAAQKAGAASIFSPGLVDKSKSGWVVTDIDPAPMIIEYVRVYQTERDIITPESEALSVRK